MKISCLESCFTQRKKTTMKGSDGLKATRAEKAQTSARTRQWCCIYHAFVAATATPGVATR